MARFNTYTEFRAWSLSDEQIRRRKCKNRYVVEGKNDKKQEWVEINSHTTTEAAFKEVDRLTRKLEPK